MARRGKDNNLGNIARRDASTKAFGSVNTAGGGRYGVNNESIEEEVKQATQKSLAKVSKTKATPVTINPDKDMVAQTFN